MPVENSFYRMVKWNRQLFILTQIKYLEGDRMNKLRERALVTVKEEMAMDEYPFCKDLPLVYLGEIANMPEHGIFIGQSGKCYWGYHIWNFRELGKDEI